MHPDLARQAVTTPDVDAPSAVEVLVDALLEAGILEGTFALERAVSVAPSASEASAEAERVEAARAALRRKAFLWARRRLAPDPTPLERLIAIVDGALDGLDVPLPVVGVVGANLLRLRFSEPVEAALRAEASVAVSGALPGAIVVEAVDNTMD